MTTVNIDIKPDLDQMKAWRRQIHQHPELGFEEFSTSQLVADRLRTWGYEVHTGIAVTGVVGVLRWGDGTGLRLGLRADMDALPIQEATGLPWASQVDGKMHACGHDGHTAILLGVAEAMSRRQREQGLTGSGTLTLIFQPAEELGGGGGAQRMLDEGLFERFPCDALFALHNFPGVPVGRLCFREGAFMASSDTARLTFIGKGGHGALPQLSQDPTLPAAATVLALQSIVGRNVDPNQVAVISVGKMQAGSAANVIPNTAELELSIRTLDPAVRDTLERRVRTLAQAQAAAFDCQCDIDYQRGYPVLMNDPAMTRLAVDTAREQFGDDSVEAPTAPLTGSEDCAYFLEQVPGCYFLVGNGDNGHQAGARLGPCSLHNPHYDFNDDCMETAATFLVNLVARYFGQPAQP
ncbi:M20 family metallopeptidase [Oceanimonas pelagia]|uniref:M20 family metallopeptidase n=1 Tax=Oceanimonas pelagia TaxID=3028314 RepID=A0AA50KLR5_9GAMM|nr:M20 aminoacylase family protein [Oceanimonas pelagia]WMC09305.1 M20 family metallopeptidase [Oceanimonas pelagia]